MRAHILQVQDAEVRHSTAAQVLHCHRLGLMAKGAEFKVDTTG